MELRELPARDVRPLLAEERAGLLALLASLGDADWAKPTEAGRWTVKDVALHVVDGQLGWLSRDRDGDPSGLISETGDYRRFVAALDAKNQRWVEGASGLSPRVITGLLAWSGEQVDACYATVDLHGMAAVSWAGPAPVPRWFDLARCLTEVWVHHQHIRDAVHAPGRHDRFLPEVLRTFVWAFPHQYRAAAPPGTAVQLDFGTSVGSWVLARSAERWVLTEGSAALPAAALRMAPHAAWRQLTGLPVDPAGHVIEGNAGLAKPLLDVRGIIV